MRFSPLAIWAGLLLGCSDPAVTPQSPSPTKKAPLALEHDFGIIPHGETRRHEFVLDLAALGEPFVPLRVHLECACGHAELRIRHREGRDRFVDGSPASANMPGPEEQLVLRVDIDTLRKEPVDLASSPGRGFVVLQSTADPQGSMRVNWPLQLRFGIDAPVTLRPFAALDFGRVAVSQQGEVITTLRGDEAHPGMTFGPLTCSSPNLAATLEPQADHCVLRVRCQPGELGNQRARVTVDTSLTGYQVQLEATWKVVPDLEATPLAKISLRAALTGAQSEGAAAGQFVLVTDHDRRRTPEFTVHQIVAADGRDRASHFVTSLVPVAGQPRQHRLCVRYCGGLTETFRGTILLTKNGAHGPFLPIELVVFPTQ